MNQISCSTLPFRDLSLTDALQKMADLGIARVELCVDPHHSDPNYWNCSPEKVLQQISRLGIQISSIHVPVIKVEDKIDFNILQGLMTLISLKTIDLAARFGAGFIVQHIYYADEFENNHLTNTYPHHIILDFKKVSTYAAEKGINLALENLPTLPTGKFCAGIMEVMDIAQGYPDQRVGICLDVTHCVASGIDPLDILDRIDMNRLLSIHASDNYFNSHYDQHLPIGKGEIDWKKIFKRLEQSSYKGALVIEVSGNLNEGDSLIDSIEFLRKLEVL